MALGLRAGLLCVAVALACCLSNPVVNVFGRDHIVALMTNSSSSLGCTDAPRQAELCLHRVDLLTLAAPYAILKDRLAFPADACTLPSSAALSGLPALQGMGQLSLSADGRFTSVACYRHSPGTRLSQARLKTVALVGADGIVDTSTSLDWPNRLVYSAVTENGTSLFVATGQHGLHGVLYGATAASEASSTLMYPGSASKPVRHVTLVPRTDGTMEAWLSAGEEVIALTLSRASPVSAGSFPWSVVSPRVIVTSPPGQPVFSHTLASFGRGGRLYADDQLDKIWTPPSDPFRVQSGSLMFTSVGNVVGVNGHPYWQSVEDILAAAPYRGPAGSFVPTNVVNANMTVHSGLQVAYMAAQLSRYRPHLFRSYRRSYDAFFNDDAVGSLYATSPFSVYNVTFVLQGLRDVFSPLVLPVYTLSARQARTSAISGISLAPYSVDNPPPPAPEGVPTPMATLSPTITASALPRSTSSPTRTFTASASPSPQLPEMGDFGRNMGVKISRPTGFALDQALILARIGDNRTDRFDYRRAVAEAERTGDRSALLAAQPIFYDVIDRLTGTIIASLPFPTTRDERGHLACTWNYAGGRHAWKAWPKPPTEAARGFTALPCYDALVGEIIPDTLKGSSHPHPKRVVAQISSSGYVDSRTYLSSAECVDGTTRQVQLASAAASPPSVGYYFYVATRPFPDDDEYFDWIERQSISRLQAIGGTVRSADAIDADDSGFKPCGIRFVGLGTPEPDVPLLKTPYMLTNVSFLSLWVDELQAWSAGPEGQQTFTIGPKTSTFDSGAAAPADTYHHMLAVTRTAITSSPIDFRGFSLTAYNVDRPSAGFVVNPAAGNRDGLIPLQLEEVDTKVAKRIFYQNGPTLHPPDNRTVLDSTTAGVTIDIASGDIQNQKMTILYVLTGETTDGQSEDGSITWKAGSAFWSYNLITSKWKLLAELPCCGAMWTAVLNNKMDIVIPPSPTATPSARPSVSASVTQSPPPTPPPFHLKLEAGSNTAQAQVATLSVSGEAVLSEVLVAAGDVASSSSMIFPSRPQQSLVVSRSLPPLRVQPVARGCPSSLVRLQCNSSHPELFRVFADAEASCAATQDSAMQPLGASAQSGEASPLDFQVVALPWTPLVRPARSVTPGFIDCSLSASRTVGTGAGAYKETKEASTRLVRVNYVDFTWPEWQALLLFFPSGPSAARGPFSGGTLVSPADDGRAMNVTSFVHSSNFNPSTSASATACSAIIGANATAYAGSGIPTACLPQEAVRAHLAALGYFQSYGGYSRNSGAVSASGVSSIGTRPSFAATVSRSAYGVLVSSMLGPTQPFPLHSSFLLPSLGPFTGRTRVTVGGQPAPVLWVSADGMLLHFQFPQQLCTRRQADGQGAGCGYQPLVISQPLPSEIALFPTARDQVQAGRRLQGADVASLACPPFCARTLAPPGSEDQGRRQPFLPVEAWSANAASGFTAISSAVQPQAIGGPGLALESEPTDNDVGDRSTGLYLTFSCPGFLDPSLDASICANASHPLAPTCAFGDGASTPCRPCPANSLCPGGARAQPLRGFWAAAEGSGEVIACAPPSQQRCLGWSVQLGAAQCGSDYDQSSYACLGCAGKSYPVEGGLCQPCSDAAPIIQILTRFVIVIASVVGIVLALYLALYLLAKRLGSTLTGSAYRFVDLLLFTVLLIQMLAEVSSTASPSGLKGLYEFFAAFNLQGVALPAKCLEGIPPFLSELLSLSAVLTLAILFFALSWWEIRTSGLDMGQQPRAGLLSASACCRRSVPTLPGTDEPARGSKTGSQRKVTSSSAVVFSGAHAEASSDRWSRRLTCPSWIIRHQPLLAKMITLALIALYARTARNIFSALDCFDAQVTVQQAAALDGADDAFLQSIAASGAGDTVTVSLLRLNPSFMCYRSQEHRSVAALSWVLLFLYLCAFPCFSVLMGSAALRKLEASATVAGTQQAPGAASKGLGPIAEFLLGNTLRPSAYFFRQFEMGLLFVLSLIAVFWKEASSKASYAGRGSITCLLLSALLGMMLWLKPYTAEEKWRLPVRALSFLLGCLVAVINALQGASTMTVSAASLNEAVQGLGIFLVVCVALYMAVLAFCVGRSMVIGAQAEATLLQMHRRLLQKAAAGKAGMSDGRAGISTVAGKLFPAASGQVDEGGIWSSQGSQGVASSNDLQGPGRKYVVARALGQASQRPHGGGFALATTNGPDSRGNDTFAAVGRRLIVAPVPTDAKHQRWGQSQSAQGFSDGAFEGSGPEFETANPISFAQAQQQPPASPNE